MTLAEYLSERGAKAAFAKALGVPPSLITQWANGDRPVPPTRCHEIERLTGGKVTRRDLCKDWRAIWPELAPKRTKATA